MPFGLGPDIMFNNRPHRAPGLHKATLDTALA